MKHRASNKEPDENQQIRKEAFKKLGLIFLGLLLAVNTIQLARFGGIVERVDLYNSGIVDELGGVRNDVAEFASDLNEIRSFLLLPVKEYSFTGKNAETEVPDEKTATRTETALYSFINQIREEKNLEKNVKLSSDIARSVLGDASFVEALSRAGLSAGRIEDSDEAVSFKISDAVAGPLFSFIMDKKTAKGKVQTAGGMHEMASADAGAMQEELAQFVTSSKDRTIQLKNIINSQKEAVAALAKNNEIAAAMTQKKMSLRNAEETDTLINYNFVNADSETVLTVSVVKKDGSLTLKDKTYNTTDQLLPDLLEQLQSADSLTESEKLLTERKNELESIFKQAEFADILGSAGLTIAAPREEYNKVLYDVKDDTGKTVFSYAVEISSGLYKVIKDNQEIDLYSALTDGSKKNF